jgi:hypothetical protein
VRRNGAGAVLAEVVHDNGGSLGQYHPNVTVFDVSPLSPTQSLSSPFLGGALFPDGAETVVRMEAHELDVTTPVNGKPPTQVIFYMHGGAPVGEPDQWYGDWVPLFPSANGSVFSSSVTGGFPSGQTRTFGVCTVNEDGAVPADFGPDQATVQITFP